MAIPETLPIKFSDVTTELWGSGTIGKELMGADPSKDAFSKAIDEYFHPTYKGSKDRLSCFRGYPYNTTCDFTMNVVPTVVAITIKVSSASKNIFTTGDFATTESQVKIKLDSLRGNVSSSVDLYYNIGAGDIYIGTLSGEGAVITINNLGTATNAPVPKPMKVFAKLGSNISNVLEIYKNEVAIAEDTKIYIWFDNSGSMNSTYNPLVYMRDNLLKNKLIQLYNNDPVLYNNNVIIRDMGSTPETYEAPFEAMKPSRNPFGTGNVICLLFMDESTPYDDLSRDCSSAGFSLAKNHINALNNELNSLPPEKYRGVLFQVQSEYNSYFKTFLEQTKSGVGCFTGNQSLYNQSKIQYKYDIPDGAEASYYLDIIVNQLKAFGFNIK